MKKWITPVLAIVLVGTVFPSTVEAWPWSKNDDAGQAQSQQSGQQEQAAPNTASHQPQAASTVSSTPAPQESADDASPVPRVQVKSPLTDEINGLKVEDPIESTDLPPDRTYVAVDDSKNPLGITVSAKKLNDNAQLISQKRYKEAEKALISLKDWLVDATETHINLHKTLKDIPNAQVQAELEKQLALQFALLRDKAFFQLGMVSIGLEDYSGAIKNLSRVIQSQPRSPMGAQAYEVLQKIGFTEKLQLKEDKKRLELFHMGIQTSEITCEIPADAQRLVQVFSLLKANQVNVRKIELMESLSRDGHYYFCIQLDNNENAQGLEAIVRLKEYLQPTQL